MDLWLILIQVTFLKNWSYSPHILTDLLLINYNEYIRQLSNLFNQT